MAVKATEGPRVVVGVSDTAAARWALATAIGEARMRRMPLLVVHVSPMPQPVAVAVSGAWNDMLNAARAKGAATLYTILDEVCGGTPEGLQVKAMAMIGDPGRVLVELARPGDLLVVGRGRRGVISRVLTPSARRYCVRHSRTTLITVEPPTEDGTREILPGDGEHLMTRRRLMERWGERLWGTR
jgi:nucleotide-binding universal stress UspA family protein